LARNGIVRIDGHSQDRIIKAARDAKPVRGLNARGLSSRGYTVLEAGNGLEALKVLDERGGEVDLVVSDVVMPEMDGPTLLRRTAQAT
jgi:two-component system cell cycle sensor histidine kinase/response regulator CckA